MTISANFPQIRPSMVMDFANSEVLDSRVTFSRPTTGTYYDAKTSAVAEQNLVTYSQDFNNAYWTKDGTTITADTIVAPDGTSTGDKLVETAATVTHRTYSGVFSLAVSPYTYTVYAKAGERNWLVMDAQWVATGACYFNLSTGTIGTLGAGCTATITSVGNSWYRCSVTKTPTSTANSYCIVAMALSDGGSTNYTGDGTSGLYIWGAQLEQRSSATAYTATTTTAITNYIPVLQTAVANSARFDHDPVTRSSLGLLIEEQRTNLATYSEQFDNASWVKVDATVTANTIVAPDGNLTGDKLVEATTSVEHQINEPITLTTGTTYTFSVFAKAGERSVISLRGSGVWASDPRIRFTLTGSGTVTVDAGTPTGTITAIGNGWYRCTMTATTNASGASQFRMSLYNGTYGYTGDGYSGLFIWGAQLEAGAFATSYIPTVASQVTRSADSASMTGTNFSSWWNISQGTFYTEFNYISTAQYSYAIAGQDAASSTRWVETGGGSGVWRTYDGNTLNIGTLAVNTFNKVAVSATQTTNTNCANGGTVNSGTATGNLLTKTVALGIGSYNSANFLNGRMKKLAYYPIACTNAQLQGLTG